jgi:multiple sugar transport system substrate-binding protein
MALSLVLGACGGGGATPAPTSGATQAPASAEPGGSPGATTAAGECPSSAQGQTIEMWSPLTGPDGEGMTALADQFSAENAMGIKVTHVAQPEYVQKLNAAAAANGLPAMTVVRVINVGELAARNVLKPFSGDALGALGDIGSDFPDNVWSQGEFRGERYSIPLDIHALVMYYNKDMFEAAGVEEPGSEPLSREAFEEVLSKLKASGVQPIAVGDGFNGATWFQSLIRQFGGALTNDEGTEVTYASDAGVQALEYTHDLKQQYSPDVSGAGDPEVGVFKQGQAAIVVHGPWHISDLQKLDFVGFAPFPQIGAEHAVWAGSHQLALTSDDPGQQAAAGCWIKWLSDHSVDWAKAGQIPARNSVREDPQLTELAPAISVIAPIADKAIILPQVPELEGALWGQFGPAVDAVLQGQAGDVKAALEQAATQSQQIVDDNAQRYAP